MWWPGRFYGEEIGSEMSGWPAKARGQLACPFGCLRAIFPGRWLWASVGLLRCKSGSGTPLCVPRSASLTGCPHGTMRLHDRGDYEQR
jgi:hypothetical protein